MESIWVEFTVMDPWKTSVTGQRLVFAKTDCFPLRSGVRKDCALVRVVRYFRRPENLRCLTSSTIIEEIETMRKSGLASLAMMYFDVKDDKKRNLRGLLSS